MALIFESESKGRLSHTGKQAGAGQEGVLRRENIQRIRANFGFGSTSKRKERGQIFLEDTGKQADLAMEI